MNRHALLLAVGLILAVPATAWSGNTAPPPPASPQVAPSPAIQDSPEKFEARKAGMVQQQGILIADMQKRQACFEAAGDQQALMNCARHGSPSASAVKK
jgi:hypothetical protein